MSIQSPYVIVPANELKSIELQLIQLNEKLAELHISSSTKPAEEVLTPKEAMAFVKIAHPYTFDRFIKKNGIQSIDKNGRKRYLKSDLIKK